MRILTQRSLGAPGPDFANHCYHKVYKSDKETLLLSTFWCIRELLCWHTGILMINYAIFLHKFSFNIVYNCSSDQDITQISWKFVFLFLNLTTVLWQLSYQPHTHTGVKEAQPKLWDCCCNLNVSVLLWWAVRCEDICEKKRYWNN